MVNWRKFGRSLLSRLSQWWKKLWHWVNGDRPSLSSDSRAVPLSYTHYEFLFNQLLEGVTVEGWQQAEVTDFFAQWQDRTTEVEWLRWLERFGERVLGSSSPNLELAQRMVMFGEIAQGSLGKLSVEIGSALLERPQKPEPETAPEPELESSPEPILRRQEELPPPAKKNFVPPPIQKPFPPPSSQPKSPPAKPLEKSPEAPDLNSLDGVLRLLKYRPKMTQQLARQMGIETTDPEDILRQLEVRALVKSSLNYQQQGNLRKAMGYVEQAISLNSDYAIAWGIKGDLLFKLGRLPEAIAAYDSATYLNPKDEQAWYNKGMAWFKLEQFTEALISFEQALVFQPSLYPAWKNKAISLLNLGRYQEALVACDRALEMQPDDPTLQTCRQKAIRQSTS